MYQCTVHVSHKVTFTPDKHPELKQKINVLQKELKQLQNDAESAESKLKGFCEARSKANTSFFSIMRPQLKCCNLVRYSDRVQLDHDLLILEKALNGKVSDFDPSEDWKLPILIEQYKNRNVNMYTPTAWDNDESRRSCSSTRCPLTTFSVCLGSLGLKSPNNCC